MLPDAADPASPLNKPRCEAYEQVQRDCGGCAPDECVWGACAEAPDTNDMQHVTASSASLSADGDDVLIHWFGESDTDSTELHVRRYVAGKGFEAERVLDLPEPQLAAGSWAQIARNKDGQLAIVWGDRQSAVETPEGIVAGNRPDGAPVQLSATKDGGFAILSGSAKGEQFGRFAANGKAWTTRPVGRPAVLDETGARWELSVDGRDASFVRYDENELPSKTVSARLPVHAEQVVPYVSRGRFGLLLSAPSERERACIAAEADDPLSFASAEPAWVGHGGADGVFHFASLDAVVERTFGRSGLPTTLSLGEDGSAAVAWSAGGEDDNQAGSSKPAFFARMQAGAEEWDQTLSVPDIRDGSLFLHAGPNGRFAAVSYKGDSSGDTTFLAALFAGRQAQPVRRIKLPPQSQAQAVTYAGDGSLLIALDEEVVAVAP